MQLKTVHLIPLILTALSFVLVWLVFFAGRQAGFMEEFDLIRLDLSNIGEPLFQNMQDILAGKDTPKSDDEDSEVESKDVEDGEAVKSKNDDGEEDEDSDSDAGDDKKDKDKDKRGLGDFVGDVVDDKLGSARGKVAQELGEAVDDLKEKIVEKLDLPDWYSLHLQSFCKGSFKNGSGSALEVEECTPMEPRRPLELPMEDSELWPEALTRRLKDLKMAIDAVYAFYVGVIVVQGILLITTSVAAFLPNSKYASHLPFWNLALSGGALGGLFVASLATTAATRVIGGAITDIGDSVGVVATTSIAFLALTWSASGVTAGVVAYWFYLHKKMKKSRFGGSKEDM